VLRSYVDYYGAWVEGGIVTDSDTYQIVDIGRRGRTVLPCLLPPRPVCHQRQRIHSGVPGL